MRSVRIAPRSALLAVLRALRRTDSNPYGSAVRPPDRSWACWGPPAGRLRSSCCGAKPATDKKRSSYKIALNIARDYFDKILGIISKGQKPNLS